MKLWPPKPAQIDPLDDLSVLARRMPESRLFDGARVYVDAFKGFTTQEMQILAVLIRRTEKTVVTLCADTIADDSGEYGRFAPAIRTAARLRELAREHHVPVAKIRLLTENHRAADPALRHLEEQAFLPAPVPFEGAAPAVAVIPAPTGKPNAASLRGRSAGCCGRKAAAAGISQWSCGTWTTIRDCWRRRSSRRKFPVPSTGGTRS